MRHILQLDGSDYLAAQAGNQTLLLDEARLCVSLTQGCNGATTLVVDGAITKIYAAGSDDCWFIWIDGEIYEVAVLEPLDVYAKAAGTAGVLEARAPMPGNVVSLLVKIGDEVCANATLVIIESMKLEVAIKATMPGRVAEVRCAVGRSFEKDAVLVRLEPKDP